MTVKELSELLKSYDPDAVVVKPGFDHAYYDAEAHATYAVLSKRDDLSEYHGPQYMDDGDQIVNVVVIS